MKVSPLLACALLLPGHPVAAQSAGEATPGLVRSSRLASIPAGALFVGDWEWASGGEVFRLTLARNPTWQFPFDPQHRVMNVVIGQHRFTRNGAVVEQAPTTGSRPYSMLCVPADNSSITMSFSELTTRRRGRVTLTFVAGNPNQLTWQLRAQEMVYVYPEVAPTGDFAVPTTMTLTRQP